jgi:hypothetical protein
MSHRGRLTGSLVLFAVLFFRFDPVEACSCAFAGPPCQAFWKTDAVFDATVTSIEVVDPADPRPELRIGREYLVKLDVREAWKDGQTGLVEVVTDLYEASCGYSFKVGRRYLVFVRKRPFDGRWTTSICSATQEYDGTGDAAAFLASLRRPPGGGRIFGSVTLALDDLLSGSEERGLETRVRLSGGGREYVTASRGGRYEFTGLAPGSYRVELDVPEGYTAFARREVTLPNGHACSQEDHRLGPSGRITGRAVGPDGQALSNVSIEVMHRDARPNPAYGLLKKSGTTDADGFFEISGLGPGPYLLGVNLDDLPSEYRPYARSIYPSDAPDAHVLTLAPGQTIDVGTWRLPPPLKVVRVEGVITWSDGTPASSIRVNAWDRTGNPIARARGAGGGHSDAQGRFSIDLREQRVYTFDARDSRGTRLRISAPRIRTSDPLGPIRIVIQQER